MTASPKNTDEVYRYAFCADAPPLLLVPHRPGPRAETQEPPGSCSYWHCGEALRAALPLPRAPHRGPPKRLRLRSPSLCVPHSPVDSPSVRCTPHRTTPPERKNAVSLPSKSVQEVLDRLLPYCMKAYSIRVYPVKRRRISLLKMKNL